jgi:hypothetical protein
VTALCRRVPIRRIGPPKCRHTWPTPAARGNVEGPGGLPIGLSVACWLLVAVALAMPRVSC